MLYSAPLSLFLCSISSVNAHIPSRINVSNMEEEVGAKSLFNRNIRSSTNDECMRMDRNDEVSVEDCDEGKNTWDLELTKSNGSIYTIVNNDRKRCLQDRKGKVVGSTCDDKDPESEKQTWKITSNDQIRNVEKDTCMQLKKNGDIVLTECSARSKEQKFKVSDKDGRSVEQRILPMAEKNKCMKVKDSDVKAGLCSRGDVTWKYDINTRQFKYENGSKMCLDAGDSQSKEATISRCDDNKKNQEWTKREKTIYSVSSRQCLKLNSSTDKFNLRDCGDGDSFQFRFENTSYISGNISVE